jgi:LmbE family N-acetylglucosaminyl deacetylase
MEVMTPRSRFRHLRIAGFALGAAAFAGAAVLVTASASGFTIGLRPASATQPQAASTADELSQASNASTVCNDFISHLSSDLGKSQGQVNAAIQKAAGQTLADEVKNKQLTQAQADALKQKLASQPPCNLAAGLGKRPGMGAVPQVGAYRQQLLTAAASALGITAAQLKTDLAGGMSLSQIAAGQQPPVTEAQFRAKLIAQLTPLLDAAVKNSRLTAAQEQAILQRLQTGPIPFWNSPLRRPKAPAPASPATTTT